MEAEWADQPVKKFAPRGGKEGLCVAQRPSEDGLKGLARPALAAQGVLAAERKDHGPDCISHGPA